MTTMSDNLSNRDLLRLLTKSLLMLEISDDPVLRKDLIASVDRMLEQTLESRTEKNLNMLKQSLEGNRIAGEITFSSTARPSTFHTTGEPDDRNAAEGSALVADQSAEGEMDNSINDQSHVSEGNKTAEDTSILVTSPIVESAAHETSAHNTPATSSSSSPKSPPSKLATPKRRTKPTESPKSTSINSAASTTPTSKTPTPKTPTLKTPTSKTPTTYGLNNSTQTRNLRKSLHTQRLSVTDDASRKQSQSARRANVRTNVRNGNRTPLTQQKNNDEEDSNIEVEDSNNDVEDSPESDKEVIINKFVAKYFCNVLNVYFLEF